MLEEWGRNKLEGLGKSKPGGWDRCRLAVLDKYRLEEWGRCSLMG